MYSFLLNLEVTVHTRPVRPHQSHDVGPDADQLMQELMLSDQNRLTRVTVNAAWAW